MTVASRFPTLASASCVCRRYRQHLAHDDTTDSMATMAFSYCKSVVFLFHVRGHWQQQQRP